MIPKIRIEIDTQIRFNFLLAKINKYKKR